MHLISYTLLGNLTAKVNAYFNFQHALFIMYFGQEHHTFEVFKFYLALICEMYLVCRDKPKLLFFDLSECIFVKTTRVKKILSHNYTGLFACTTTQVSVRTLVIAFLLANIYKVAVVGEMLFVSK